MVSNIQLPKHWRSKVSILAHDLCNHLLRVFWFYSLKQVLSGIYDSSVLLQINQRMVRLARMLPIRQGSVMLPQAWDWHQKPLL